MIVIESVYSIWAIYLLISTLIAILITLATCLPCRKLSRWMSMMVFLLSNIIVPRVALAANQHFQYELLS